MKILCTEGQYNMFEEIEGYNPVKGDGVDAANKKNNEKYYKEAEKKCKDYDGGLMDGETKPKTLSESEDVSLNDLAKIQNKGMERLKYDAKPTDEYKKRVEAQMMGKVNDLAEDIDDKVSGVSTKGNEEYLKQTKKNNKFDNDHTGVGDKNNSIVQLGADIEVEPNSHPAKKEAAFESKMKKINSLNEFNIQNKQHKVVDAGLKFQEGDIVKIKGLQSLFQIKNMYMPPQNYPTGKTNVLYYVENVNDPNNGYYDVTEHDLEQTQQHESKKLHRLNFKKQTFLNEQHIFSLIPESYKVDNNRFLMRDNANNEFLVEWNSEKGALITESKETKETKQINESFDRIKSLFKYNSSDFYSSKGNNGRKSLNETRELIEKFKQ